MKIHYLQHVSFETPGNIEPHLAARGHELSCSPLYKSELDHEPADVDWLIVLGGPMGVHDEHVHPWLAEEKRFIREVIEAGKPVLGICLGAQLLADVLGARVYQNLHREIGWFPVSREAHAEQSRIAAMLPEQFPAFHWHGDTFELPTGALQLASSEACQQQGFVWDERVVALQFHLETTQAGAEAMIAHCGDELDASTWVQTPSAILRSPRRFQQLQLQMARLLDCMETLGR